MHQNLYTSNILDFFALWTPTACQQEFFNTCNQRYVQECHYVRDRLQPTSAIAYAMYKSFKANIRYDTHSKDI